MSAPRPGTDDDWARFWAGIMRRLRREDEDRAARFRETEARARRQEARRRGLWLREHKDHREGG